MSKNIPHNQHRKITQCLLKHQKQQAIAHHNEMQELYFQLEKKLLLKLIECIENLAATEKGAIENIVKLSKVFILLKQFRHPD